MIRRLRRARMIAAAAAMVMSPSLAARAQLVPNDRWYTIETAHFRVHFTKALEAEARRGAVNGERAFAQLSTELRAPRGKVDLVIADNIDYVNGYATTFPSNRIVVFAHPPIDAPELRNYDDWSQLVITHELTHIFHLDRADGVWRLGRSVFGRHPGLFPNSYQPAWLVEGLAVYYESRITGAGRLEGAEHYMLARSAAEVRRVPRLGELSRATSRFPGGETVYAYGAFVLDYLSRTRGPETIPKFVDITSRLLLPISLNARAKRAFGISFENAWRDWRDSLVRVSGRGTEPLPRWRDLTHDGRYAEYPRWLGDTAIMYVASTGREVASAYSVTLDGKVTRLGRRNALDANSPLPDGSVVFAQPDYIDPFHFRTDLYVENNGEETRLTRGARLTQPDARKDGAVVAVQSVPGSTRIVRVWRDGRPVQPITTGNAEVQWAEPRWSPTGSGIAAIRIRRGGISELVMLDTLGAVIGVPVSQRAVLASPSWFPSGSSLFYTSTISGSTQAYAVAASGQGTESASRGVSAASTGFFNPELSPNERNLSGLSFRFDGYHVGVAPANTSPTAAVMSRARGQREGCRGCRLAAQIAPPLSIGDVGPARRYSPWQSLAPRYWEPLLSHATRTGTAFGAATSGVDVIGRHSLYAEASFNTNYRETSAFGAYQYGGFGQPYLNLSAQQEWEHFSIFNNSGREVGDLARRARIAGLSASFVRPRARTYSSFSLGGELESRTYGTDPDTLLARLPALFAQTHRYPSVFTSASWTNTMRPALSISREDGISVSATARQRWESGDIGSASRSIVGVTAVYKSLDLPGFAHHVIAARAAAGYADSRAISSFSVGGLSGGSLDVLEGLTVGGERRTFGVRGFPPSAEQGIRAFAGSLEYRAPIAAPSKRVPFIPLLFDRISISTFGEAGRAYCPASAGQTQICTAGQRGGLWLASAGTELDFDTALQYDVPARFRLGVAVPVVNRAAGRADAVSVYLTIGSSF